MIKIATDNKKKKKKEKKKFLYQKIISQCIQQSTKLRRKICLIEKKIIIYLFLAACDKKFIHYFSHQKYVI